MKHIAARRTSFNKPRSLFPKGAVRRLPIHGGTTTLTDCLVALRYLADPRKLVHGPAIIEYEQAFAKQVGVRYAYSFCHARVGLYGLLLALGVGPGDEVLLQVPTHVVVSNAIRYTGARPVYVDCRLDNYNMDLEQAEQQITPRTRVLILQHSFGIPVELDAALDLARRHGLDVIEDCVHALGATYDGRQVGSFGRAAIFSTEHAKTISTAMGGMVVTDDAELAAKIAAFQQRCTYPSALRVDGYILKLVLFYCLLQPWLYYYTWLVYELFGQRHPLPHAVTDEEGCGGRPPNYEQRLSNAQAAVGLRQLQRLSANLAHRRATAAAYSARLPKLGFDVPRPPARAEPAFVRYPVWVKDPAFARRAVARYATLGDWFNSILSWPDSPAYADYVTGSCPRAEEAIQHLINLPTHPWVRAQDAETIVSAVARAEAMTGEQGTKQYALRVR